MDVFVGIDNGVTGTIGFIDIKGSYFFETPVKKEQDYVKKKSQLQRIDQIKLHEIFSQFEGHQIFALIERPMVNPKRWAATISAIRALESTISYLELNKIGFEYIDSKEWQKALLPSGLKGPEELKKASHDIGIRMFPNHKELISNHKDADGLLIAEYTRRKFSL